MKDAIDAIENTKDDVISRRLAVYALWKALYKYEDEAEKQFQESEVLDVGDWMQYRIFVQNMSDIDRQTILGLPPVQLKIIRCKDCKHRPTLTRADEGITSGFSVEFPDESCPCQCADGFYNWYPGDDFYCGYAERREE